MRIFNTVEHRIEQSPVRDPGKTKAQTMIENPMSGKLHTSDFLERGKARSKSKSEIAHWA